MRPPLGTSNEAISDAKRKRISPSDKQPSEALSEIIKRNQGVTVLPRDHLHVSEAEADATRQFLHSSSHFGHPNRARASLHRARN